MPYTIWTNERYRLIFDRFCEVHKVHYKGGKDGRGKCSRCLIERPPKASSE